MPVTYYTAADRWSNSPGFPEKKVGIDKVITSRCLECHLTYAEGVGGTAEEPHSFNPDKIIYGVDCEKCHGPAAAHVSYHASSPKDTAAKYIVNPARLSRNLQMDICALCHAGNITKSKPSFTFTAGKELKDHFTIRSLDEAAVNNEGVDVHGNQLGLLKASQCYIKSSTLTCNTCHNTHVNERGQTALFSQRCMGCHNTTAAEFKTPTHNSITAIEKNCIDCHMPAQPSRAIAVFVEGEEAARASLLRTHLIKIYPNETNKFNNQALK
jgi:transposase-like protein